MNITATLQSTKGLTVQLNGWLTITKPHRDIINFIQNNDSYFDGAELQENNQIEVMLSLYGGFFEQLQQIYTVAHKLHLAGSEFKIISELLVRYKNYESDDAFGGVAISSCNGMLNFECVYIDELKAELEKAFQAALDAEKETN